MITNWGSGDCVALGPALAWAHAGGSQTGTSPAWLLFTPLLKRKHSCFLPRGLWGHRRGGYGTSQTQAPPRPPCCPLTSSQPACFQGLASQLLVTSGSPLWLGPHSPSWNPLPTLSGQLAQVLRFPQYFLPVSPPTCLLALKPSF